MREWIDFLGVIGQQLANILWYDRITAIAGKRVAEIRHEAEVEWYERGFKHGEQAERDRSAAEAGGS